MEPDIDGVKFAGGAVMAMQRSGVVQLVEVAHDNGAYASCAGGYELAVEKVIGIVSCAMPDSSPHTDGCQHSKATVYTGDIHCCICLL